MGLKIWTILAIIMLQFGASTASEEHIETYPEYSESVVNSDSNEKINCTIENPDETSICYKVCILKQRWIFDRQEVPDLSDVRDEIFDQAYSLGEEITSAKIEEVVHMHPLRTGYNYTLNAAAAEPLGLYKWSESTESLTETSRQAMKRLSTCDELSYVIPRADEKDDCKDLDPKYHESMQKMVACIEDAVKCLDSCP